jgi:hypothetical protein
MSALTKPLINSTKVIGGASDPINVEKVISIAATNKPSIAGRNEPPRWSLTFHFEENGAGTPNFIEWKYDNVVDRDADLASILTLASTTLV